MTRTNVSQIDDTLLTTVPEFYSHADRKSLFKRLRHEGPVTFHDEKPCDWLPEGGRGYWAVTRFEDIRYVTRNPQLFSSAEGSNPQDEPEFRVRALGMLHMDGDEHRKYRAIVSPSFAMRHVSSLKPMMETLAAEIIDGLAAGGERDIVSDVVNRYPVSVIAALLGLPDSDLPMFVENTRLAFGPDRIAGAAAHKALIDYGTELGGLRRADPKDDLVTRIVEAEFEGRSLSDDEVGGFVSLLIGAGAETTGSTLAIGIQALAENPEQLELLRSNPDLIKNATDEIIRYASAVINFRRNATQDVELGGQLIKQGEKVVMFYESGNFDEDQFATPEAFDISRENARRNMSFGAGGPHQCLGEQLGKLEIATFIEVLLARVASFRVTERVQLAPSPRFNMVKKMKAEFDLV
jgi:cytochrome P450